MMIYTIETPQHLKNEDDNNSNSNKNILLYTLQCPPTRD